MFQNVKDAYCHQCKEQQEGQSPYGSRALFSTDYVTLTFNQEDYKKYNLESIIRYLSVNKSVQWNGDI